MLFCPALLLTFLVLTQASPSGYKHSYKYFAHLFPEYYSKSLPKEPRKSTEKPKPVDSSKPAENPNIVFIMADDLGWNDVSWNNPDVITPNLQSLASNGVILNQSYVQAICSPSRAAYLTGLYPFRTGFQGGVVLNGRAQYLPLNLTLLPERLKRRGYSTHLVGKWHLGHCRVEATPTLRGFDSFFGCYSGAIDYFTKFLPEFPVPNFNVTLPKAYDLRQNLDVFFSPPSEYTTELFSQRAIDVINQHNRSVPLYLSLHYTAPHFPLQVPERYLDYYPDVTDPDRKAYLAMVTAMDEGIGKVIDALRYRKLFDNTIIIFTSDNGGIPGRGGASNFPLRGQKGGYFEGGVRSPTLVHSPNFIANPGRVSEDLFHIVDWFPTLLAATGVKLPGRGFDGTSQWSMLTNGTAGTRTGFVYQISDGNGGIYAIRRGRFKLIQGNPRSRFLPPLPAGEVLNCLDTTACPDCQLYDLQADPSETTDLVCQKPNRVRVMFNRLQRLKLMQVPSVFNNRTFIPASAPELNDGNVNYGWC